MADESDDDVIMMARVSRCRDSTPLGIGIAISGPQFVRLGIDPVETDAVDVRIEDELLRLVPGEGEPVIAVLPPPSGVKEQWTAVKRDG